MFLRNRFPSNLYSFLILFFCTLSLLFFILFCLSCLFIVLYSCLSDFLFPISHILTLHFSLSFVSVHFSNKFFVVYFCPLFYIMQTDFILTVLNTSSLSLNLNDNFNNHVFQLGLRGYYSAIIAYLITQKNTSTRQLLEHCQYRRYHKLGCFINITKVSTPTCKNERRVKLNVNSSFSVTKILQFSCLYTSLTFMFWVLPLLVIVNPKSALNAPNIKYDFFRS